MARPATDAVMHRVSTSAPVRTVFDHLPKTAGTSVRAALACALGEPVEMQETTCPHRVAIRTAGERRCVASHLWFYPGEPLAPDWYYATLLRDPVDRFLSQYSFYRSHHIEVGRGLISDPDVVAATRVNLAQYLLNPARRRRYHNIQALHFAWRMCHAPEDLDDVNLLDAATASLEDYDLIGVFADVPGFLNAYCEALGVPRPPLPRLNVTTGRTHGADVPPFVIEQLREANRVDTALYDWAHHRFAHRRTPRLVIGHRRAIASPANFGDRQLQILASRCEGTVSGGAVVRMDERVAVKVSCRASVAVDELTAGIAVRDQRDVLVYATNSRLLGMPLSLSGPQTFELSFVLALALTVGEYHVTLALHKGLSHQDGCFHWLEHAASFVVRATICGGRVRAARACRRRSRRTVSATV